MLKISREIKRIYNFKCEFEKRSTPLCLRFPGAGTIKLEMASSLMELSVGGGGQTKLSIMSTLRALGIVDIGGGSVKSKDIMVYIFLFVCLFLNRKNISTIQFYQKVTTELSINSLLRLLRLIFEETI